MKKLTSLLMVCALLTLSFAGCGSDSKNNDSAFKSGNAITVVSREDGSGTRGAFIDIFAVEEKDADGNKVDKTIDEAIISNNTNVVMTTVAGNKYSIGYISLGSLNNTVKAVKIDGVEAIADNIVNGSYKVSRPFNIATKGEVNEITQDFIDFILSSDGQKIVEDSGYIKATDSAAYSGSKPFGKITVAGSSSVSPVMEKLKEAYLAVNTNAKIEIQQNDSSAGMNSAISGTCDIGMA